MIFNPHAPQQQGVPGPSYTVIDIDGSLVRPGSSFLLGLSRESETSRMAVSPYVGTYRRRTRSRGHLQDLLPRMDARIERRRGADGRLVRAAIAT